MTAPHARRATAAAPPLADIRDIAERRNTVRTSSRARTRLAAAALLATIGMATAGASTAAWAATPGTELPHPGGRPVGVTQLHLVDGSRPDPWTHAGRRELPVSAFYPARHRTRSPAPYLSPVIADALAQGFQVPAAPLRAVRTHSGLDVAARPGRHAVVLVSPGVGLPRSSMTVVAEDLAAHGYVALAIDHPGDAAAVELPGGRIRPIDPHFLAGLPDVTTATRARRADVRFLLERLPAIDRRGILRHRLDTERIAMVGHSLGGSTAANVMLADRRVDAGVNYDGDYFLDATERAPERPLMTMTGGADDNQGEFFARQRSGGLLVTLAGAQHDSFSDLSFLGSLIDGPVYPVEIGTISPAAALAAQRAYTRAFLAHNLLGRPASSLLSHRTARRFPAVTVRFANDARDAVAP